MDKLNLINFSKYTITKNGEIISKRYGILNGHIDKSGYVSVCLKCTDDKPRNFLYHRVVWFYFNGEIPQNYEINHKDEDKTNNSLDNLELLTRRENVNYGTRNIRAAASNSVTQKGKKLSNEHIRKLSIAHSKPILQYNLETKEPIKEWQSSRQVERELGFSSSTIGKAVRGIYSQAYGYGWKHV